MLINSNSLHFWDAHYLTISGQLYWCSLTTLGSALSRGLTAPFQGIKQRMRRRELQTISEMMGNLRSQDRRRAPDTSPTRCSPLGKPSSGSHRHTHEHQQAKAAGAPSSLLRAPCTAVGSVMSLAWLLSEHQCLPQDGGRWQHPPQKTVVSYGNVGQHAATVCHLRRGIPSHYINCCFSI